MTDMLTIDDPQYHEQVMLMVNKLFVVLNEGPNVGVGVNALITLLAVAGQDSPLDQPEYCKMVAYQLDHIMSTMNIERHSIN